MNLVEVFGLLGTLVGVFLGVLGALFLARWLLSTPPDPQSTGDDVGAGGPRRRLSRILLSLFRGHAR